MDFKYLCSYSSQNSQSHSQLNKTISSWVFLFFLSSAVEELSTVHFIGFCCLVTWETLPLWWNHQLFFFLLLFGIEWLGHFILFLSFFPKDLFHLGRIYVGEIDPVLRIYPWFPYGVALTFLYLDF